jgi:Na+/melibiose symporter-like transporter
MIVIEVLFFLLYYHTEIQKPSIIFCLFIYLLLTYFYTSQG